MQCTARVLITVIAMSDSKLCHSSILRQWTHAHFYVYTSNLRLMQTQKHYYHILIVFMTAITDQIKKSGDKHVLATLNVYAHDKYFFIDQEERMVHRRRSTIFKNGTCR